MSRIYELTDVIRRYNFHAQEHSAILFSALDAIADIELAKSSYLGLRNISDEGINYVYICGIINLLDIQSDAIKAVFKIILNEDMDLTKIPEIDVVRILRNKIFAHPVDLSSRFYQGFGVVRSLLTTFCFSPYVFNENMNDKKQSKSDLYSQIKELADSKINQDPLIIDVRILIKKHESIISNILNKICKQKGYKFL